jgi:hypothetical protein
MVALQQVHDDAPIVVGVGELFRSTAPPKQLLILQPATSTRQTGLPPAKPRECKNFAPKNKYRKNNQKQS